MKKLLMVVVMLLLAMPVMAATSITAVKEGTFTAPDGNLVQTVRIDYTSDVDVRAFALDINIANTNNAPNFQYIRGYKTGENTASSKGYGIFPSRFRDFVNPSNPDPCYALESYNPTAAWNEPDTINPRTGLGFSKMTVELGTLFAGDANKPALSGTLFRFDVNNWGQTGTFHLTIAANATRGGIVGADAAAIAGVVFNGTDITFGGGCPAEPNVAGMTRAAAVTALTGQGFVVSANDNNVPPTTAITTVGNVVTQSPPAGTTGCGTTVTLSKVVYPIKTTTAAASLYVNWVTMGKPACWAYSRHCRGDADGKKLGNYWVSQNDLIILKSAISKLQSAIPAGGICASFTHKKLGNYWVSQNDLIVLKANISKLESVVPVCGDAGVADANYWYYCVPTGATCPAEKLCAPVGICPNTP